jgi:hypothetical protein
MGALFHVAAMILVPLAVAQCEGKRAYRTWKEAEEVRKRMARHSDSPVTVYRCRTCTAYHLGRRGGRRF